MNEVAHGVADTRGVGRNIKVIVTGMTYNHDCGDEGFGDSIDFTASIVK